MAEPERWDCLVVGGGPAGLAAGVYLGRFRRRVLVVDAGNPRAALIPTSHNLPGFPDGLSGGELLARMRCHAERYGARLEQGRVTSLSPSGDGFAGLVLGHDAEPRPVAAATILLATGVVDVAPALPDLPDAIQRGLVRHCPICDGYEVMGRTIGVIGFGKGGLTEALFLRTWSEHVTLLTLGQPLGLDESERRRLAEAGVAVVDAPVVRVAVEGDRVTRLETGSGTSVAVDALYSALGVCARSDLAVGLGAAHQGGTVRTDDHQETSVAGLFAAGDVTMALNQVAVAAAQAATAATAIHRRLLGF